MLEAGTRKLAIEGGAPIRTRLLPYGRQTIREQDVARVVEALRSDFLTTGPEVERLEAALARRCGASEAVAVCNGTAALHAAIAALGLDPEDEVLVPAITFAASANCVRYSGARVVFVDVERATLNLDPEAAAAAISPRTRAIIAVDFAGRAANYSQLQPLAQRHGLALVADSAHALGATHRNRPVAQWAGAATLSFHPVKHITCGEGGAVVTNDGELAKRARVFRNHGIDADFRQRAAANAWEYSIATLGHNLRLSDLHCALAGSQLEALDANLARRRELAAAYQQELRDLPWLDLPLADTADEHAWHLYVVRLRLERLRVGRGEVFRALRAENIGVNVHYIPVPWHPYYQGLGYRRGQWPTAEGEYERLLTLPLWPGMSDQDLDDVINALGSVLAHFARD